VPLREIDRQLIDNCLKQEPGAWNDFVDRYMGLIYHVIRHVDYARSVDLSEADIEDVAADVFLGIVEDNYGVLRRFKGQSSLPSYLTVVARRIAIRSIVKRGREAELGHVNGHRAATQAEEEPTADTVPVVPVEEVERMLKGLPEREAEIVRLYHLKFLTYRQIAKQLGIPQNSIGPILSRALKRLRKMGSERTAT
jgi:RNA polymerase sigma-70 factor (ECF subfamily)